MPTVQSPSTGASGLTAGTQAGHPLSGLCATLSSDALGCGVFTCRTRFLRGADSDSMTGLASSPDPEFQERNGSWHTGAHGPAVSDRTYTPGTDANLTVGGTNTIVATARALSLLLLHGSVETSHCHDPRRPPYPPLACSDPREFPTSTLAPVRWEKAL